MKKTRRKSKLFPDFIASSVLELKPEKLRHIGITHLVFDIDETVVPKAHNQLTDEYIQFLQNLETQGFTILIGSNSRRDLSEITQHLNTVVVSPGRYSFKPLRSYFRKVIQEAGVPPRQIAMIGDRVLNDVIGANMVGLVTILVEPYARRQSPLHKFYVNRAL